MSPFTPSFIFYLSFRTLDIDLKVDTRIQGGEWCSIGHGSRFYTGLYYFKGSLEEYILPTEIGLEITTYRGENK